MSVEKSDLINIENSLSSITDNTSHIEDINTTISRGGDVFAILEEISRSANGLFNSFTSYSTQVSNPSNPSPQSGGTNYFTNVIDEIKDFRKDVLRALSANNNATLIPFNATLSQMTDYFKNQLQARINAQRIIDTQKGPKRKAQEKIIEDRRREREERELRREKFKEKLRTPSTYVNGILGGANAIAKGVKFDDVVAKAAGSLSKMGPWGEAAGGVVTLFKGLFDLYAAQDKAASQYAREIGGGRTGKAEFVDLQSRFIREQRNLTNGYSAEEMAKFSQSIAEQTGRSIVAGLSTNSIAKGVDLTRMGIGADAVNLFDTFGKSLNQTDRYFTELYQSVSKKGLSFKNVSKAVNDNLKQAQQYSFSNGLKSLEKMAEKSTQLKFGMQQAFTFAEKMSTFEGAMETSANLSVLGGDFARYANPMQLMYEGLNNVDALQDRIIKMFGNRAEFDKSTGQMRISSFNQQLIKQAAQSMGLDSGEMMSLALNQGKFNRIENQLRNGSNRLDDETKEYIKNLAQLDKDGNAFISINGKDKLVSELTNNDKTELKNLSDAKATRDAAGLGDIYQGTMGISEKLDNILKYLTDKLGAWVAKIAGVKWDGDSGRHYWDSITSDERQELIKKYGTRSEAKRAVGILHKEDENVDKHFGNKENRERYDNQTKIAHTIFRGKTRRNENAYNDVISENVRNRSNTIDGNSNRQSPSVRNVNSNASSSVSVGNTTTADNTIVRGSFTNTSDALNVTPTNIAENIAPKRIEVSPIRINLGGQIDLALDGKHTNFDINDLTSSEKQKLSDALFKYIYKDIETLIAKSNNKEHRDFSMSTI